jgi:hypothetical protein
VKEEAGQQVAEEVGKQVVAEVGTRVAEEADGQAVDQKVRVDAVHRPPKCLILVQ